MKKGQTALLIKSKRKVPPPYSRVEKNTRSLTVVGMTIFMEMENSWRLRVTEDRTFGWQPVGSYAVLRKVSF
jgi:hypothetical protein